MADYEPNLDDLEAMARASTRATVLTPATALWLIAKARSACAVPAEPEQAGPLARQFMRCADVLETFADGGEMGCTVSDHLGIYECRPESVCTGCRARHRIQRDLRVAEAGKAQVGWVECRHGYMPPAGEKVLFWCRGWLEGATPGIGDFRGDFWEDETQTENYGDAFKLIPSSEVTHWMPLPSPPTSKEGA
jgi:hypothetical protein